MSRDKFGPKNEPIYANYANTCTSLNILVHHIKNGLNDLVQ